MSVEFNREADEGLDKGQAPTLGSAELISVSPGYSLPHDGRIKNYERRCASDTIREIIDGLFVACRASRGSDMLTRGVSYKALPEVYQAPSGKPFIVECLSGPESWLPVCDVSYKLHSDVNIFYKLVTRSSRNPDALALSEIVTFDRTFRAAVEAAWIKDYSWRTRKQSRSTK